MPVSIDGDRLKGQRLQRLKGRRWCRTGTPPYTCHETYPPKPNILHKSTSLYHATRFLSLRPAEAISRAAGTKHPPYACRHRERLIIAGTPLRLRKAHVLDRKHGASNNHAIGRLDSRNESHDNFSINIFGCVANESGRFTRGRSVRQVGMEKRYIDTRHVVVCKSVSLRTIMSYSHW